VREAEGLGCLYGRGAVVEGVLVVVDMLRSSVWGLARAVCGSGRAVVCHSVSGGEMMVARVLVVRVFMWSSMYVGMGLSSSRSFGLLILFHLLVRCSIECVCLREVRCCVLEGVSGGRWRAHGMRRVAIGEGLKVGVCCGLGLMMCVGGIPVSGLGCPRWCVSVHVSFKLCVLFAGLIR
jgi:hypothetical protein